MSIQAHLLQQRNHLQMHMCMYAASQGTLNTNKTSRPEILLQSCKLSNHSKHSLLTSSQV
jgi:hypothetical protein